MRLIKLLTVILGFVGTLLIIFATGTYTESGSVLIMGHQVILNLHPNFLKIGLALVIVCFILQITTGIFDYRQK